MNPTLDMLRAKGYKLRDGVLVRDPVSAGGDIRATLSDKERASASIQRIGQGRRQRMNRLEQRWLDELKRRYQHNHYFCSIQPQFRVRISDFDSPTQSFYTADFAVWERWGEANSTWRCILWECKDKRRKWAHSDELTRPKMARQMNPWIAEIWLATFDGNQFSERRLA